MRCSHRRPRPDALPKQQAAMTLSSSVIRARSDDEVTRTRTEPNQLLGFGQSSCSRHLLLPSRCHAGSSTRGPFTAGGALRGLFHRGWRTARPLHRGKVDTNRPQLGTRRNQLPAPPRKSHAVNLRWVPNTRRLFALEDMAEIGTREIRDRERPLIPRGTVGRIFYFIVCGISIALLIGCILMTLWSRQAQDGWITIGAVTMMSWLFCGPLIVVPLGWSLGLYAARTKYL